MNPKRTSRVLLRVLYAIEDSLLVLALSVMILIAFAQIVLRNLAEFGLFWGDPLLRYLVLWIGLLGAMVATRENNHITIDVVSYFLPSRARAAVRVLTDAFSALVCFLLTYASVNFLRDEIEGGLIVFGRVPAWAAELILPVAFGVMGLRFLVYLGLHLRKTFEGLKD
jgi:TRAP-type C4-dicarboxylate transport system permease small subunit